MEKGDTVKLRGTSVTGKVVDVWSDLGNVTNKASNIVHVKIVTPEGHMCTYTIDELKLIEG